MSKPTPLTLRQQLVAAAPERPKHWMPDEQYHTPMPDISSQDKELLQWLRRHEMKAATRSIIRIIEDAPTPIQKKLESAYQAERRQTAIELEQSQWAANRSAWLDAKWRCYWADTVIREEAGEQP